MSRPLRLLDLFCGGGGAGVGYARAGFAVTGVDLRPQKHYPLPFIQTDALEYLRHHGHEYDVIHASPPCQRYSPLTKQSGTSENHPDLIAPVRELLLASGRPYVIENVVGARAELRQPIMLCGAMFPPLFTYRHRLFESNVPLVAPAHPKHVVPSPRSNGYQPGQFMTVCGHVYPVARACEAMGIDWPLTQYAVAQAIPPAYTTYLGHQLVAHVRTVQ